MPDFRERLRNARNAAQAEWRINSATQRAATQARLREGQAQERQRKESARKLERETRDFGVAFYRDTGAKKLFQAYQDEILDKGRVFGRSRLKQTQQIIVQDGKEPEAGNPVEIWYDKTDVWYQHGLDVTRNNFTIISANMVTPTFGNANALHDDFRFEEYRLGGERLMEFPSDPEAYRRFLAERLSPDHINWHRWRIEQYLEQQIQRPFNP